MWDYVLHCVKDVNHIVQIIRGIQSDDETMNAIAKLDENSNKLAILFKIHDDLVENIFL
jgi:hypothetical protein